MNRYLKLILSLLMISIVLFGEPNDHDDQNYYFFDSFDLDNTAKYTYHDLNTMGKHSLVDHFVSVYENTKENNIVIKPLLKSVDKIADGSTVTKNLFKEETKYSGELWNGGCFPVSDVGTPI